MTRMKQWKYTLFCDSMNIHGFMNFCNTEETLKKGWYISVLGVDVSRDDMSQISHPHDNLSKQWKNCEKTVKK